jgi:hypothetical protein
LLANAVSDHAGLVRRIGGVGPVVDRLEWDVKLYFALAAATHDAACAAWALKRYYSGPRPITLIRYMASMGQSSDAAGPSFHPQGLPLHPGVVEVITTASSAVGERHEYVWDVAVGLQQRGALHVGKVAIVSWPGEHVSNPAPPLAATHAQPARWMLARDWLPFQRKTFNTPAFPGYISGHSTFSRAAAEVLSAFTGSEWFPGGMHQHAIAANSLQMDLGPSQNLTLQWATYFDAADQAGQSRRWGGIHVAEDDYDGRVIGHRVGKSAWQLASRYWDGSVMRDHPAAEISIQHGRVTLTARHPRGMFWHLQQSSDLHNWNDLTAPVRAYQTDAVLEDLPMETLPTFYRVVFSPQMVSLPGP